MALPWRELLSLTADPVVTQTAAPLDRFERAESRAWMEIQRSVDPAFRDRFGVEVHEVDGSVVLLAPKTDMLAQNRVWMPGSAPLLREETLDGVIALFRARKAERFVLHWRPDAQPAEAPAWFAARGFRSSHPMAKLFRQTDATLAYASDVEVIEIAAARAGEFGMVAALGSELGEAMAPGFNSTVGLRGWTHYLAMYEGRPIAAALLNLDGGIGWCGLAGTLPAFRGRGAQSALLTRRVRDAALRGCAWVVCETMAETAERPNPSFRNMRRLGFELAYVRPNFILALNPA